MAELTYNGISLSYLLTQSIAQEPVMDPSGTDVIYFKFRLSVQAQFNPALAPALPVGPGQIEYPSATMARVRHMLLQPRQELRYTPFGGPNLVVVPVDDANGPFPISCTVTELNPTTWAVAYVIETRLTDCGANLPYLSLRWSESTDYDSEWRAIKKRAGLLIVSPNGPTPNPDNLRGVVTPGVPIGFRRESAHYELDETNLRLRFSFVDKQLLKALPLTVLRVQGQQIETIPMRGGQRIGELRLSITGYPGQSPQDLLTQCLRIGMSRVYAADPFRDQKNNRMMIGGTIAESLDDDKNVVSLTLQWKMNPVTARSTGAANLTTVPGSSTAAGGLTATPGFGIFTGILAGAIFGPAGSLAGASIGGSFVPPTTVPPTPQGANPAGVPLYGGWVGKPFLGGDPSLGIAPPTQGVCSWVNLVGNLLNDPCGATANVSGWPTGNPTGNFWTTVTSNGATVSAALVNNLPADDNQSIYASAADDPTPGIYDLYKIQATYKDDTGLAMIPAPSPTSNASFVQVTGGTTTCELTWTVTRLGGPPALPATASADPNAVYLHGVVIPDGLDAVSDGVNTEYTVSGTYYYGFKNRNAVNVAAPIPAFLSLPSVSAIASQALALVSAQSGLQNPTSIVNPFLGIGTSTGSASLGTGGPPVGP